MKNKKRLSKKAVVLASGGLDSSTCLGLAVDELGTENVSAISINYGQKHGKEQIHAKLVAEYYDVPLHELDLSSIFAACSCPLMESSTEEIPEASYDEQIKNSKGIVSTYVPLRNAVMLTAAASYAYSIYPDADVIYLYLGAHADDAAGAAYADCTPAFNSAISMAISRGSYDRVKVMMPFIDKTKANIVEVGMKLEVPYHLTYSCYNGEEKPCGKCATCIDRAEAFAKAGFPDPALEYSI